MGVSNDTRTNPYGTWHDVFLHTSEGFVFHTLPIMSARAGAQVRCRQVVLAVLLGELNQSARCEWLSRRHNKRHASTLNSNSLIIRAL